MIKNSQHDRFWALGLALIALAMYAGFLSQAFVFEGLIRAMPIETGRWVHLLPGNYLLYGPLGLIFHTLFRLLGVQIPAVVSLQILDALLGAAGVGVFYLTLRRLGGDRFAATVWSGVLAFSLGYWLWSTDAEDYILSTFLLITNFFFLVKYVKRETVDSVVLGALHGLAVLGHIVNVVFGLVILWVLIAVHRKQWQRPVLRYIAGAVIVAGGAYGMVVAFVRKPATVTEVLNWFAGSAGPGTGMPDLGGAWNVGKFWEWLKMSLHILGSFSPTYQQPPAWMVSGPLVLIAWFLLGTFAVAFFLRFDEIYQTHRAVLGGCVVWLGIYACVFTRWQPWTMVYRVSDLVPLITLLFLGYQSIPANRKIWQSVAAILVFCLAIGNLGAEIRPRSFASNNPNLERMAFLKAHTGETDWITGDGGQDEIYIPYFAQRRPIVIQRYAGHPEILDQRLQSLLSNRQNIFVTSRVLERDEWKTFFKSYTLTLRASRPDGFALYQVGRYHEKNAHPRTSSPS